MGASNQRSYLLMRHGASSQTTGQNGLPCTTGLSKEGHDTVRDVAHGLAEALSGLGRSDAARYGINVHVVLHGTSELATATAQIVHDELTRCGSFKGDRLSYPIFDGRHASPWSGQNYGDEEKEAFRLLKAQLGEAAEAGRNAVAVVGHLPLFGILARRLTGRSVPLARAEIACLTGDRGRLAGWRLQWTITPSERQVMQELREKIVAKMTVAGMIGSVIAAGLVFLLDGLFTEKQSPTSLPVALRYGAALCLFLATLVAHGHGLLL
jgi:phosphohistidine phosphatase SixA